MAGYEDDAVSVFRRDANNQGKLTFVEVEKGGIIWTGLNGCYDLALSPDGANLYATGYLDDTLVVFSVDRSDGELTLQEVHRSEYGGLFEFDGPRLVAVTPDGSQVWVSATHSHTLFLFDRHPGDGTLVLRRTLRNKTDGLSIMIHPTTIVFSEDGLNAYVGCENGGFVVLACTPDSKEWFVLEEHANRVRPDYNLWGVRYLVLSPDQSRLYVSARGDGAITVYCRDLLDGTVSRRARVLRWRGTQNFGNPHQIAISPDGAYGFLATGEDALHCFNLRGNLGEISHHSVVFGGESMLQGLAVPTQLCVSPDGLNVYCPSHDNGGIVTTFTRDPASGELSPIQMLGHCGAYTEDHGLSDVEEITVSPNCRDVYSCSVGHDAIAHFYRDPVDGRLVFQAAYFNNSGFGDMDAPHAIALSPDGRHLYAVGNHSHSVVSFQVQGDGSLVSLGSLVNGRDGFDRLDGPTNLCLSPDGKHLYVTAYNDDAVIVFSRDHTTGLLTYQGFVSDDLDGVEALDSAQCVIVSPDGKHVYVGAYGESAVACFARSPESGRLGFIEAKPTSSGAGRGMAFNAAGTRLYMGFTGSDSVVAFSRDSRTGQLKTVGSAQGNPPVGLDGMNGPYSLAISPDDQHLYVTCVYDDCVRTFGLTPSE